jgi:hypothetical protein
VFLKILSAVDYRRKKSEAENVPKSIVLFTQSKSLTFPFPLQLAELDTIVANVGWTTFI